MARRRTPVTPAVRSLRAAGIPYTVHLYRYEDHAGAPGGADALGVDPHVVIKTLVMEDEHGSPLVVLMHGDREVSTKRLARIIGCKSIRPCDPEVAERHSGYRVGGTSPFGLRTPLPLYLERSITTLDRIYVNGGARGFLVALEPSHLVAALGPQLVEAGAD
jgi:Cys-tRNA(Pro) deacylase